MVDLSDGCGLATAFEPRGQGGRSNPDASLAEPQHVQLAGQVGATNRFLTAANTLRSLGDCKELFEPGARSSQAIHAGCGRFIDATLDDRFVGGLHSSLDNYLHDVPLRFDGGASSK
jgi:hypothetical protein